jgi:hypothetical protein
MKILSKIKKKLGLKNKQSEKIEENAKEEVLAPIPPISGASIAVIRHFQTYGGTLSETPNNAILDDQNPINFKGAGQEKQLKMLYSYIVKMSEDGIYKKQGDRTIAEHFNVGRNLIHDRFEKLIEKGYLIELKQMNRFYKIKEWVS